MSITDFDRTVLESITAAIKLEENHLRDNPLTDYEIRFPYFSERGQLAHGYGIKTNFCHWSGLSQQCETTSKRWQRSAVRLEKAGLIERIALPRNERRTHVRLTVKGRQLAKLEPFEVTALPTQFAQTNHGETQPKNT